MPEQAPASLTYRSALAALIEAGAKAVSGIREVGEDLLMDTAGDLCGNQFGIVQRR